MIWISDAPHRRDVSTSGLAAPSLNMTAKAVTPTVEILAGCASRMEYVFSVPAHNVWGCLVVLIAPIKERRRSSPILSASQALDW